MRLTAECVVGSCLAPLLTPSHVWATPTGEDVLAEMERVPVYTFNRAEASGGGGGEGSDNDAEDLLDGILAKQKSFFLDLGTRLGDERAVDRRGTFLKRVEVLQAGVMRA